MQLRHVLKLSPEKWEEVCQHALSAVQPDGRHRVWWCQPMRIGLVYPCKNGAVHMESPIGEAANMCIGRLSLDFWLKLVLNCTLNFSASVSIMHQDHYACWAGVFAAWQQRRGHAVV